MATAPFANDCATAINRVVAILAIGLTSEGLFALIEHRTVRPWGMPH